ncbi:MAG: hypothetical protein ACRCUY_11720 [Thermoguttaceae bacterium]
MMKPICVLMAVSFAFLFSEHIFAEEWTQQQLETIAVLPASHFKETDRIAPPMLSLFKEEEIIYTGKENYDETTLKFRLHVPENIEPGKKYPLIFWLHGVGEIGTDNKIQLVHLHHIITYLTGEKKEDFFLLVPQAPRDHSGWDAYKHHVYEPVTEEVMEVIDSSPMTSRRNSSLFGYLFGGEKPKTKEERRIQRTNMVPRAVEEDFSDSPLGFSFAMLDYVMEKYPVDPNRITVSGLSSGGDGTWRALERRPNQFAAAVPLVSWSALTDESLEKSPQLKQIPIWAIYSSDDRGIEEAREEFERVQKAGCNVKKTEFGVCSHNAWTPAMLQADIFSWLLSRAKKEGPNGTEFVGLYEPIVSPDAMQGVVDVVKREPQLAPPNEGAVLIAGEPIAGATVTFSPSELPQFHETATTNEKGNFQISAPYQMPISSAAANSVSPEMTAKIDSLYAHLFFASMIDSQQEAAARIFAKIKSPENKIVMLKGVVEAMNSRGVLVTRESIILLERLIDSISENEARVLLPSIPKVTHSETKTNSTLEIQSATKKEGIIPNCENEWDMTSESLYGMFPSQWSKEAENTPQFVFELPPPKLAIRLLDSINGDGKEFEAVCRSILDLQSIPLSSPWFNVSGGRLSNNIQYSLTEKGQILRALLSTAEAKKYPTAEATYDKINRILEGK